SRLTPRVGSEGISDEPRRRLLEADDGQQGQGAAGLYGGKRILLVAEPPRTLCHHGQVGRAGRQVGKSAGQTGRAGRTTQAGRAGQVTIALTLYSRPGCHLCADMKTTIERTLGRTDLDVRVEEIDISDRPGPRGALRDGGPGPAGKRE